MTPELLFVYVCAVIMGIGLSLLALLFIAALMGVTFGSSLCSECKRRANRLKEEEEEDNEM